MEQFDRVAADPRLRRTAVEADGGNDPGGLLAGEFQVSTSGYRAGGACLRRRPPSSSNGWPRAGACAAASGWMRALESSGSALRRRCISPRSCSPAFGGFGGGRPALSVTTPLPEIIAALNRDRPEGIVTVPTIAGMLAEEQLEGRLGIAPRRIIVGGEVRGGRQPADGRRRGIEPFQVYSSTEALFMAWEGPGARRLPRVRGPGGARGRRPGGSAGAAGRPGLSAADHQPRQPCPAADPVRARRHGHARGRPLSRSGSALRADRARGRPKRRPDPATLEERRGEAVEPPYRLRAPFTLLPDVLQYQVVHRPGQLDGPDRAAAGRVLRVRPACRGGCSRRRGGCRRGSATDRRGAGRGDRVRPR